MKTIISSMLVAGTAIFVIGNILILFSDMDGENIRRLIGITCILVALFIGRRMDLNRYQAVPKNRGIKAMLTTMLGVGGVIAALV